MYIENKIGIKIVSFMKAYPYIGNVMVVESFPWSEGRFW